MNRVLAVAWLTGLWLILWRSTSPAAILTGIALSGAMFLAGRSPHVPERPTHRVRPLRLARFVGHVGAQLLRSNIVLAAEILTPTDRTSPGIIAVRLPPCSDLVLTVVANSISLSPGTLTLDVRREPPTLYVHVLHLRDAEASRAEVEHLHHLAVAALPVVDENAGGGTP